jgi:hypothetical protein
MFKVMNGEFGDDGLISKHKVFEAETAEACWKHIYDTVLDAEGQFAKLTRLEALTGWVEEHNGPGDYDHVWVQHPYPHAAKPEVPDWIKHLMGLPMATFDGTERLRGQIEANLPSHLVYQLNQLAV